MGKWLNYSATVLIVFLIFSGIGRAEPNSTMRYLMNEPVSLLDFGIFRLETFLKSKDINNFFKVDFDSDDKKIVIIFAYFGSEDIADKKDAENKFRNTKWQVQEHLGIDPLTCRFHRSDEKKRSVYSDLNHFFRQFNTREQPDISGYEMYSRTKIRGMFMLKNDGILDCKADLMGTTVHCSTSLGLDKSQK
jgi:hypothetical protein